MLRASFVHRHLGLTTLSRLTALGSGPAARHRASVASVQVSSTVAAPRMGRGGDAGEQAVSSSGVLEAVAEPEQHPIRVNPRSDKFGVHRFHHVEFWTPDATGAAKRCVRRSCPLAACMRLALEQPFTAYK